MENESNSNGVKIFAGILAVLLVVAGAFAIKLYNKEKDTKTQLTKEKNVVLADLRDMVDKYDVVIEDNNLKDTELNEARDRISKMIEDINAKDATISSLGKYRSEVYTLRKERDFLFAQNDSLRGSNQRLAMRVDSTTYEMELQRYRGDSLYVENTLLERRVEIGKALSVAKLRAIGVIERSSGKLVENSRARRIDKVRACFTVTENRIADTGNKKIYVQVIDPKKRILGANKTVNFDDGAVTYSNIEDFYFEGKALDICSNVMPAGEKFEKGLYQVNIYDEGNLISQSTFEMK